MLKLQFQRERYHEATHVDSRMLANTLLKQPALMDHLIYAMGQDNTGYFGNGYGLLQYMTQGMGNIGKIDVDYEGMGSDRVRWALKGNDLRPIPIAADSPSVDGDGFLGRNGAQFVIPFSEQYFSVGDILRFPDGETARVQEKPYQEGNHWCYRLQLVTGNPNEGIIAANIPVGTEIAYISNAFEEGSHGGSFKASTPAWFENQMTTLRKSFQITGSAYTDVIRISITDKAGKKSYSWMPMFYADFLRQWFTEVEHNAWFSRYNRSLDGSVSLKGQNGLPVIIGSGIEEQVSQSNHIVTDRLSEDLLYHMLIELAKNAKSDSGIRRVLVGGQGFLKEFHDAMVRAGQNFQTVDSNFISKLNGNKLAFGSQFTTYKGFGGTEFSTARHPMFDNHNIDPTRVGPYAYNRYSYMGFFLDFSDIEGKGNISMVPKVGPQGQSRLFNQWTTGGSFLMGVNDKGAKGKDINFGTLRSHDGDYSAIHFLSEQMVKIWNPYSCGLIEIRPGNI